MNHARRIQVRAVRRLGELLDCSFRDRQSLAALFISHSLGHIRTFGARCCGPVVCMPLVPFLLTA